MHPSEKPAKKRTLIQALKALRQPKAAVMAGLGFSSGLPFLLTGNTLGYWLREGHVSLTAIGFASWVGMAYSLKFLWAPVIDKVDAPFLSALGRRRSWMLAAQIFIALGLGAMALIGPTHGVWPLALAALVVAFASATQDINVDAWRIEIADDEDELGLLTSAYQLGYRSALIVAESVILILAQGLGWPGAYAIMAALVGIGLLSTWKAGEPKRPEGEISARDGGLFSPSGLYDAVVGPFIAFFKEHGAFALLMLGAITLYHLPDYLRGPITNPFYKDLGLEKATVGLVRGTVGLWALIAGISLGGISALRLGHGKSLIIGALIQPVAIALFATLALYGAPLWKFEAVMAFDNFAIGYSGVALVSYMSSLTSFGYTATQYALLSSALNWTGKTLKGFSGAAVDHLHQTRDLMHAYADFYLSAAALGLPAIILCLFLARRLKALNA